MKIFSLFQKKILFSFFLFTSLSIFCTFLTFSAGVEDILNNGGGYIHQDVPLPKIDNKQTADAKINSLVSSGIEIILAISGFVAVIFLVIGGIRYTISAGDEDMINGARAMILYSIIGLFVIIFSYAILTNLLDFLQTSEG